MRENDKKTGSCMAQDSLTTTHLEKGLTSAHIKQQLANVTAQAQPAAATTNQPSHDSNGNKSAK